MSVPCTLELLDEPLEVDFEDIRNATLEVFFAAGRLAPLAPVLALVGTVGEPETGRAQPLVSARLDPFAQRVQQIGWFTPGETWHPAQVFLPLVARTIDARPNFLLLSEQLTDEQRLGIALQILHAGGATPAEAKAAAAAMLGGDYLWPALREFLAAWQSAGESSSLPPDFAVDEFRTFLTDVLVASLWWPEPPGEGGADSGPAEGEWAPNSAREVRVYLHSSDWQLVTDETLVNVLRHCLMLYGKEVNEHDIAPLALLYAHVVAHTTPAARASLVPELAGYVGEGRVHAVVLLPMVVKDAAPEVVASATAQLLALSPVTAEGERYAYAELRELLRHRGVANPGAVFGALVAHAGEIDWPVLEILGAALHPHELLVAATSENDGDLARALRFWLAWRARVKRAGFALAGPLVDAVGAFCGRLPPDLQDEARAALAAAN